MLHHLPRVKYSTQGHWAYLTLEQLYSGSESHITKEQSSWRVGVGLEEGLPE